MKRFYCIILGIIIFTSNLSFSNETDQPVNVKNEVINFYAKIKKDRIRLYWVINNPDNLKEIRLQTKKIDEANYTTLDPVKFSDFIENDVNDSTSSYVYSYRHKVEENGVYYYKITLISNDGKEIASDEIKLGVNGIPDFELLQNNPNPFNPSTLINYKIYKAGKVSLKIYNMTGKQIAVLVDQVQNPGSYSIEFNTGNYPDLSSGIYFYKLQTNNSSDIKKMIFAK
jgi:hypothetical protein